MPNKGKQRKAVRVPSEYPFWDKFKVGEEIWYFPNDLYFKFIKELYGHKSNKRKGRQSKRIH